MIKLCFKIWAVANLAVLAIFCLSLVPRTGVTALLYSSLFSLPAIIILYALLLLLNRARGHHLFSWVVLLSGTALSCLAAFGLFRFSFPAFSSEFGFVLPLSFISGYSAVVLFSSPLHYLF